MNAGRTSRRLDAAWLREGALPRLLAILDRDGEEARIVGGAVRNALIGEPVHEYDIATTAVPDEVVRRVTAAGVSSSLRAAAAKPPSSTTCWNTRID